jgi:acetylornithine/N-succinyldiaminopimelate aminotransferase
MVLTRGKGVFLYDLEDRRYLDFVSGLGVNVLGHAHPRIVKTLGRRGKLIHVFNLYYREYQEALRPRTQRQGNLLSSKLL